MTQEIKKRRRLSSFRELGLTVFIIALCALIQLVSPRFLTASNIDSLLTNTAIIVILAIGMMIVILTQGIDLSVGANIALSGMVAALLVKNDFSLNPLLLILIGTAVGLVCGAVVGALVSKLNVLPIIATLGMGYVYRGTVTLLSGGAWVSAHQMPDSFKLIATGKLLGFNNLIAIALIVLLGAQYFLGFTRTGRRFYAVGSNPEASSLSGIDAVRTRFLAYAIMGALAGMCGVLWVSKFASAQPDTAMMYEGNLIAACVIGGVSITGGSGKVIGVFLGALLIGIINNALPLINFISEFSKNAIQGSIILGAIIINVLVKRRAEREALARRHI